LEEIMAVQVAASATLLGRAVVYRVLRPACAQGRFPEFSPEIILIVD
jgi:hypothetical protein